MSRYPAKHIAAGIVNQFGWSSNVMVGGKLVGQQYVVAEAIRAAIELDREITVAVLENIRRDVLALRRKSDSGKRLQQIEAVASQVAELIASTTGGSSDGR